MSVSIGMALIAKNEEETLPRILKQLTESVDTKGNKTFDQIVVVDTGSTDKTVEVAQSFPGVKVAHFPWVNRFDLARNFSFDHLTTDWKGWCDCDDVWVGLEHVRPLITDMHEKNPQVLAVWTTYFYDQDPESQSWLAIHERERFTKSGTGWVWKGWVHEHQIIPPEYLQAHGISLQMAKTDLIRVEHQRDRSRDVARNDRNVAILKQAVKANSREARLWFDLGSQMYHTQRWRRCMRYYKIFIGMHQGVLEKYQAHHRIADCWRALGKPDRARHHEYQAIALRDDWQDAYLGLAECALMEQRPQTALNWLARANPEYWAEFATKEGLPDAMVVLNPLDYTFHDKMVGYKALGVIGRFLDAHRVSQNALQVVPTHPEAKHFENLYRTEIQWRDAKDASLAIAKVVGDAAKEKTFGELPIPLRRQKDVRDAFLGPIILKDHTPDLVIFCGASLEDWGPETPTTTGIGGSETAVINVARGLGQKGVNVAVYNQCGAQEGRYGSVRYIDFNRYEQANPPRTKVYVSWRNFQAGRIAPKGSQRWLWMHDLNSGPQFSADWGNDFDLIRPVSRWHGEHLEYLYPFLKGKIVPTRNGIDLGRFGYYKVRAPYEQEREWLRTHGMAQVDLRPERNPFRLLYSSSPDRGLEHLLAMWPMLKSRLPQLELHIAYGWETFAATANMRRDAGMVGWMQNLQNLGKQEGITWTGRLNQTALAKEMQEASVLAYPGHFLEVSCISAMEAMAAGAIVLATKCGALSETCGDAAVLLDGHPASEAYRTAYAQAFFALIGNPEQANAIREKGYERVKGFTWDGVVQDWYDHLAYRKELSDFIGVDDSAEPAVAAAA